MNTVYVVTTGEYSAYRIKRIFSTRELADGFVEASHDDDARVEEYELDEAPIRFGQQVRVWWLSVVDEERSFPPEWVEGYEREVTVTEGDTFTMRDGQRIDVHMIDVTAPTLEHAQKVLGERKARYLAEDRPAAP